MKSVIVLELKNGIVECVSNKTDVEVMLHDFDIQNIDNPNFEYGNDGDDNFMIVCFPGEDTPADFQPNKPNKVKSLAQYLDEYIEHEYDKDDLSRSDQKMLEQALDAYESTEQVKIRIEKV